MERVTIRTPATSANVGPGYDAFGLALGLYNTFSASPADEWSVEITGEGAASLRTDAGNRVAESMRVALAEAGSDIRAAHIVCRNEVPTGRGLGSSAAAIVGGLMLADALAGGVLGKERVFELAAGIEGHSDNVAAATWGGFTLGWEDDGPRARVLAPDCGIAAIAVIAEWELPTAQSRGMLPESVAHADAVFNVSRAGLLVAGLATGDREMFAAGLADRLHQRYRASAVRDFELVTATLMASGCDGAVLSGAGPTIIGLVMAEDDDRALERARGVCEAAAHPLSAVGGRRAPLALPIDREGARRV